MKAVPRLRAPEAGETPLSEAEVAFGVARQLVSRLDKPLTDRALRIRRRHVPAGMWTCSVRIPSTPFSGLVS